MRVLLGPLNHTAHRSVLGDLEGLDVKSFDRDAADIRFQPGREPLETLWSRLPAGWSPDCLIWWSPEYSLIPEGIERCPVPSIAVLGDWNLGTWTSAPLLEAYDLVVTDARGVGEFRPQLATPVERWPAYSYNPALHRCLDGIERDIDVLFVGNANPDIQVERAPWLARLARLSDRYRVLLASGVYGEEYAALLNRARIVWNRSIRGELNMRAYEAPACGAVLLMEAENLEVRTVFEDGRSCLLYNAENLEDLIERALADREALDRMAEAGWRSVQQETYREHIDDLLKVARTLRVGSRPFGALPPWRRDYWLGLHALASPDADRLDAALRHFGRALDRSTDKAAVSAALGALAVCSAPFVDAQERPRTFQLAAAMLAAALQAHPDDVVTRMNLAWVSAVQGQVDAARTEWNRAAAILRSGQLFPLDRPPLPLGFDRFRAEWERAALPPSIETRADQFRRLLEGRIAANLARTETNPDRAVTRWTESVMAAPGIESNVRRLAEALEASGDPQAALLGYTQAVDANPFDWDSRLRALHLALTTRDTTTLARLVNEGRRLAAAVPGCQPSVEALESLLDQPAAR